MRLITDWFKRNFSDPQIVFLVLVLTAGFAIVLTMGDMLAPVLASVVIAYLLSDRLPGTKKERNVPAWGLALFGLTLGLLAGVVNVFAPLIVIFALETRMKPELMVATFNISFLTSKSGQIAGFVSQGAFQGPEISFALLTLPLVLASLWAGIRLRKRIDVESYRKALRFVLWIVALYLIIQ